MEVSHAKLVLEAILEGCDDEAIIKELIDLAWRLIREEPQEPEAERVAPSKPKKAKKSKEVKVNLRTFPSVMAACRHYGMKDQYKTALDDLGRGVCPEDIFPKEKPIDRMRLPIDEKTGLVLN